MEIPNILEFVIGGFYSALSKFGAEFNLKQEQRDVVLTDKLNQILQNQSASDEAIAAINTEVVKIGENVAKETAQVSEGVQTLSSTNAQLTQSNTDQAAQIKQLLAQQEEGTLELNQANQLVDQLFQKSTEQLEAQKQAVQKISQASENINAIFTPSTPPVENPPVDA